MYDVALQAYVETWRTSVHSPSLCKYYLRTTIKITSLSCYLFLPFCISVIFFFFERNFYLLIYFHFIIISVRKCFQLTTVSFFISIVYLTNFHSHLRETIITTFWSTLAKWFMFLSLFLLYFIFSNFDIGYVWNLTVWVFWSSYRHSTNADTYHSYSHCNSIYYSSIHLQRLFYFSICVRLMMIEVMDLDCIELYVRCTVSYFKILYSVN